MILPALLVLAQAAAPTQIQPPAGDDLPPVIPIEQKQQVPPPARPEPVPPVRDVARDPAVITAATRELTRQLASDDFVTRAQAIEAIQRGLGKAGADLILPRLRDRHPLPRFAAAMAAGQLQLRRAGDDLLRLANDPDPIVPAGAIFALHRLGDTRLSDGLVALTQHPDPQARGNAVLALGLLGERSALDIVNDARDDQDVAVRLQALEAAWRLGDTEARKRLVAGTMSRFGDDQLFCVLALSANGATDVSEHVRSKLTDEYSYIRLNAARSLGRLGSDDGYGVAQKHLRSSDPRDRQFAALALGEIGRADARPLLEPLLKDRDAAVRLAAAQAILQVAD